MLCLTISGNYPGRKYEGKIMNMRKEDVLTEDEKALRGLRLIEILGLKRSKEEAGRYLTTWGTKTALGIYLTVKRILEEKGEN
jgi:hypothetical protein